VVDVRTKIGNVTASRLLKRRTKEKKKRDKWRKVKESKGKCGGQSNWLAHAGELG
jgi:hypothetical protein